MTALPCPKCEGSKLKEPSSGTQVLRCYECGGMWLAADEAKALALDGTIVDPASMLPTKSGASDARTGFCPKGHGLLIRARVEIEEDPFYLEQCPHCVGIWFDHGEWHRLASSRLLEHLSDFWNPAWQRRRRAELSEARHKRKLAKGLGEYLVDSLDAIAKRIMGHPLRNEVLAYLSGKSEGRPKTR